MSNIVTYIVDGGYIIEKNDYEEPPSRRFVKITANYDILDENGNKILLRDNNKINNLKEVLENKHKNNYTYIISEIEKYKKIISDLEFISQKSSQEEYEKISEDVNRYIEMIANLNKTIDRLNYLFESKKNLLNMERSRTSPRRNRSNSPLQQNQNPRRRVFQDSTTTSAIVQDTGYKVTNVNGWDENVIETVRNWRILFKENKYIYEWILEKNYKISTNLNLISVVSSSLMGCFSAFKLWIQDDRTFQATSDIIMLFSNFLIAAITTSSKRYIDDNRNEKIRNYLEEVSQFLGNITSELIKTAEYRMNGEKFIKTQQEIYSKLIINKPNITISELTAAKNAYRNFENSFVNFESQQTQTSETENTEKGDLEYHV